MGTHGFNCRHGRIPAGLEGGCLLEAFRRDFRRNGPSLYRLIRTTLRGWRRYEDRPGKRIRHRYERYVRPVRTSYDGAIWAMGKWFEKDGATRKKTDTLLKEIYRESAWKTRIAANVVGRYLPGTMKREAARLGGGWSLEPDCRYDMNPAARAPERARGAGAPESQPIEWERGEAVPVS